MGRVLWTACPICHQTDWQSTEKKSEHWHIAGSSLCSASYVSCKHGTAHICWCAPCCGPVLACIAGTAANDCYLTRHADSSKSATLLQQVNETDIRTDTVPLYRPSCAYYAGQCQKSPMGLHRPLDSSGGVATKLHHLQWQYLVRSFSCKEFMHVLTQLATLTLACEIVNVCCI